MPKKSELHIVVMTAIIVKRGKVLIGRRNDQEVAYPGKWTVPGGKFDLYDFKNVPKTTSDAWYGIVEPTLAREIKEETGLKIKDIEYLTDYVFVRPDGYSVVGLSYWCRYAGGQEKPSEDLVEFAWIKPEKNVVKKYDLIEGIPEEIIEVGKILKKLRK